MHIQDYLIEICYAAIFFICFLVYAIEVNSALTQFS